MPLYSVYVFDDGQRCTQVPHRFFASVNGDMIWSGFQLARITGETRYLNEALATARAVDRYLSDPAGVFADLQAENDIVEPLVEGMFVLAKDGQTFARRWILRNAAAALSARKREGTYGRFFDGPPPRAMTTAWQTNGGFAIEIAAAALAPKGRVATEKPLDRGALRRSRRLDAAHVHHLHRLGDRIDRDARRALLRAGPRARLRRREGDVRRHRDLAEQIELGTYPPGRRCFSPGAGRDAAPTHCASSRASRTARKAAPFSISRATSCATS